MAAVEGLVRETSVLPPEQQRNKTVLRQLRDFRGRFAGTLLVALRRAPPRGEADDVDAVGDRLIQRVARAHPGEHVPRLMSDPFDPVRVVLARLHEAQVLESEVLQAAHHMRNVHEVLRLVENDDDAHATSSRTPNRDGSWRSPRNHTQPLPPLHTSCPARRARPGSISLMIRSNPMRAPTCGRACAGHGTATVTRYPCSVRSHRPCTAAGVAPPAESVVATTRTPPDLVSGTIR